MTLTIDRVHAGYGGGTVLHGVDLVVPEGAAVAVLGMNGAGKTTLVHTIAGLVKARSGSVRLDGVELAGRPAHRIARAGVALVPQGRRVFASLTVAEHLTLSRRSGEWTRGRVLELLPRLGERLTHKGNQLSGGEAQMLAIARALLTQPRLLLLDEPCEGLAVDLAARVRAVVAELIRTGLTVLLVEQQPEHARAVTDQPRLPGERRPAHRHGKWRREHRRGGRNLHVSIGCHGVTLRSRELSMTTLSFPLPNAPTLYAPPPALSEIQHNKAVARIDTPDGGVAYVVTRYADVRHRPGRPEVQPRRGGRLHRLRRRLRARRARHRLDHRYGSARAHPAAQLVARVFTARRVEMLRALDGEIVDGLIDGWSTLPQPGRPGRELLHPDAGTGDQ